jgi:hypothetical protein
MRIHNAANWNFFFDVGETNDARNPLRRRFEFLPGRGLGVLRRDQCSRHLLQVAIAVSRAKFSLSPLSRLMPAIESAPIDCTLSR